MDPLIEHVVPDGTDAQQDAVIDCHHRPQRGPATAFDHRQKWRGLLVVALGARPLKLHQSAKSLVSRRYGFVQNFTSRETEALQVLFGQVDAAKPGIFRDVAHDIRQLKRHAAFLRKFQRRWCVESEHVNRRESDHRRCLIAVAVEFVEGAVDRRPKVALHAVNQIAKVLVRNFVALDRGGERR